MKSLSSSCHFVIPRILRGLGLVLIGTAMAMPAHSQTGVPVKAVPTAVEPKAGLQCKQGPIKKTYGTTDWLVYSCDDNRSVLIVAAPGSPAAPFYFMFAFTDETGYRLSGEGTGNTPASDAALDQLKTLSGEDIADLIGQTRQPQNSK